MNFDLSRMQLLMHELGDPQNQFPAIHIAGTNGKGSTAAFVSTILRQSGKKVGLYTSPHLVSLHERFQINGTPISSHDLSSIVKRLIKVLRSKKLPFHSLTQFEMLTAIAFIWFAEQKIDMGVIEVGLGGRLDATNVMQNVWVSVITNIDLEHTQILGKTIRKITGEKAGIIKPGVPVVTAAAGEALLEIRKKAKKLHAPLHWVGSTLSSREKRIISSIQLLGEHQKKNAAVALKTIDVIALKINDQKIGTGFSKTRWPGRFDILKIKSATGFPRTVILDGAHNPAATTVLAQTLAHQKTDNAILIFGVLRDKNYDAMIRELKPHVETAIAVPLNSDRSASKQELHKIISRFNQGVVASSLEDGWKKAQAYNPTLPILVTGSLYLVGEFMQTILKKKEK